VNLLLDTHIFLWGMLNPSQLRAEVAAELENPQNELWLSSISVWETLILAEKARIRLDTDPQLWVRNALKSAPLREIGIDHAIAMESRRVELPHQDPADRFLAATAIVRGLTLVTSDSHLLEGAGYEVLSNRI